MGLSAAVRAQIVDKNLKRTIQRARVRNEAAPANPRDCAELDIPDTFKEIILDGFRGAELLLQYDSGAGEHRILIFGTGQSKILLEMSEKWHCDGTFKVTSPLFSQVYSIHATRHGDLVLALYCLLTNKSKTTYQRLFQTIRQLIPNARATSFLIDFEMSAINAIRTVFDYDNVAVNDCFFISVKT